MIILKIGKMNKKNEIVELTFEFAKEIIDYCELLENERKYVISKQLLRSELQ